MIDNVTNTAPPAPARANLVMRHTPFGDIAMPEQHGDQYNFGLIFGAAANARTPGTPGAAERTISHATSSPDSLASTLASANAAASAAVPKAAIVTASSTDSVPSGLAMANVVASAAAPKASTIDGATVGDAASGSGAATKPGLQALVTAIMSGAFQPTYITDPTKLTEINPVGTDQMPNFYYASDQTANQLAQLLGGKVVQQQPFSTASGWSEPRANFIQLSNGQTVNAANLAYYARCGAVGATQLTADLTQAINQGSAWNDFYQHGGQQPSFGMGYVGAPIAGMDYPPGMIGADGMVINPAMKNSAS